MLRPHTLHRCICTVISAPHVSQKREAAMKHLLCTYRTLYIILLSSPLYQTNSNILQYSLAGHSCGPGVQWIDMSHLEFLRGAGGWPPLATPLLKQLPKIRDDSCLSSKSRRYEHAHMK